MQKYKSLEYNEARYSECIKLQQTTKKPFKEHLYGSRRKLIIEGRVRATTSLGSNLNIGGLTNEKFVNFLALFSKHLYKRLHESPFLYTEKITFRGVARSKNNKFWKEIKDNTLFYNIDLKSAYWQIAHQLGYIDTEFFNRYMFNDDYKQAKRYCISFLARKNKMTYYNYNKTGDSYIVDCDITLLKNCYNNIRNQLYRCISKAVSSCSNYIEFNIDGVYVLAEDVDNVRREFKEMNLIFKITKCIKLNDCEYKYDSKIRNFKTKRYE